MVRRVTSSDDPAALGFGVVRRFCRLGLDRRCRSFAFGFNFDFAAGFGFEFHLGIGGEIEFGIVLYATPSLAPPSSKLR